MFTREPILKMADKTQPFELETDASLYGTGGVLRQNDADGLLHPVAYISQSFNPAERNYQIYDRELLAIINALEDWRHFLEGLPQPFEIVTDHKNLEYWKTAKHLTRRQARWYLTLSRFDFFLTHRRGKDHTAADGMTRNKDGVTDADDNQEIVMLKPEHFRSIAALHYASAEETVLTDRIKSASQRDAEALQGLEDPKHNGLCKMLDGSFDWEEEDGLVYHRGKIYVPDNGDLRRDVIKSCHDTREAGHPGRSGTLELVSRSY